MAHNHEHHHHHHLPHQLNILFAIAVSLNLGFTALEVVYATMANSMSLLADAGHNLGDVVGLAMAGMANWLLTRPSSDRYSYGFKRTSILAALFNALILVGTSVLIAYESINKLLHPQEVQEYIVIIIAFIGIFINGGTALLFIKGSDEDLNVKGAFLHLAADALISVGVVVAGIVILFSHWHWVDPVVGLVIVALILISSWSLLRDSVNLILDAVPTNIDHKAVEQFLLNIPGVEGIHDFHIWGLSTKEVALTVHLIVPDVVFEDSQLNTISTTLRHDFSINHATIQVEKSHEDYPCGLEDSCQPMVD
ncbi:MAG: cation diffusion facilitator family transporter [Gammaproteobacteria bacterium]